jgi:hypothetical protein
LSNLPSSSLSECSVSCHESLDHRHNQLSRIGDGLACGAAEHLGIRDQIAMYRGRQFESELDRLIIGEWSELELRHGVPPWP